MLKFISQTRTSFIIPMAVLLGILLASAEGAQEGNLPDPRFGIAEAFWSPADTAELHVGWERILFYWREIQPEGPEDWNTLHVREEWLREAQTKGRSVVGLLKNTPTWASEDGTEAGVPRGLYLDLDDPLNFWANYTRRVAGYYAPLGVHHWIIWNEPDIASDTYGHEFAGTIDDYYQLLKVAYLSLKEIDPEATVHLAGLTWWHDPSFLQRLLDIAAADPEARTNNWFFDAISLHVYFRPESVGTIIRSVDDLQKAYGLEKPIWINETNAPPNMDPLWPVDRPVFDIDLQQQAWYIIQATTLAFAAGAERVGIYKLSDVLLPEGGETFGLIRQDGSRRPAYTSYATAIAYLEYFDQVSLKEHPNYFVATFSLPESVTRIAWARSQQDVILEMPVLGESVRLVDYHGQTADVSSINGKIQIALEGAVCHQECLIGGPPLFIIDNHTAIRADQYPTSVAAAGLKPTPVPMSSATPRPTASATASPTATPTERPSASPTPSPKPGPEMNGTGQPLAASTSAAGRATSAAADQKPASTNASDEQSEAPFSTRTAEEDRDSSFRLNNLVGPLALGSAFMIAALLMRYLLRLGRK